MQVFLRDPCDFCGRVAEFFLDSCEVVFDGIWDVECDEESHEKS